MMSGGLARLLGAARRELAEHVEAPLHDLNVVG